MNCHCHTTTFDVYRAASDRPSDADEGCRENAVRYMVETKTIHQELIDECLWDCCDDTRELVKAISTNNNA